MCERGSDLFGRVWKAFAKEVIYLFIFVPHSRRDLSSRHGIEPMPSMVEVQSLNHWTTKEVPDFIVFKCVSYMTEEKCKRLAYIHVREKLFWTFFLDNCA